MKKLTLFLAALIASTTVLAQKAPILPKEWKGSVSATSFGAVNRFNPKHPHHVGDANAATEWNALDEARTLTIVRQEGQHLELVGTKV
jgi:nitrogen fixation protein FixH